MPVSFVHLFRPADRPGLRPLLLLHGTGGDETQLVGLAERLSPDAAVISPRGKVSEGGANRFFRRFGEGRFDHEDVRQRADELAEFIAGMVNAEGLTAPLAIGYSNGANISSALLWRHPGLLAGAVLLRGQTPLPEAPTGGLAGVPVMILTGAADPIVPETDAARLAALLGEAGASVRREVLPVGHQLTAMDLAATGAFLQEFGELPVTAVTD
jgi:phospholipase/carboxylesterase